MTFDEFQEVVRSIDGSTHELNYEIYDVLVVQYFAQEGTVPIVAMCTRDGRHRVVMVDNRFYPDGKLSNWEGDDDETRAMFDAAKAELIEQRARLDFVRDFVLRRTDDDLMQLKDRWMREATAA